MKFELKHSDSEKLIENITGFTGKIYFGIPRETSIRPGESIGEIKIDNATILSIMEHGSPVKNIPPRELLKPVLLKHMDKIKEIFAEIYGLLLTGDEEGAYKQMEILAQRVETWAKAYFVENNGWAPNAPSTIRRKGSDRPLIDTGALRSAIRGIFARK